MLGDEDGGNKGGNYKQKNIFAEHASFDADEGDGGGAWVVSDGPTMDILNPPML